MNIEKKLKEAKLTDDIAFLEKNKDKYDINHRFADEDDDTFLMSTISDPDSDLYKYFIERGADLSLLNGCGENIVHAAVFSGILERIELVLNSDNINHQSNDGTTPLLLSICIKKYDVANYLIEKGSDIHIADNELIAPIHMASLLGNIDLVVRLVERGASLDEKTEKGNLPLALAIRENHIEVVKFLYKKMYGDI
ncbi:MAG: ankyrin repeat domain-containing protein [Hyphomicrobiales bacterium]